MVLGSEFQHVELSVAGVHPRVPGAYEGGDVLVAARVRQRDFSGATLAWVVPEAWKMFLEQLTELERTRSGEAMLQSIGPEELRLRIFALDRAGHIAVEGELTSYYALSDPKEIASLKFGVIEFDPTTLPLLVRELQSTAPEV
jgi:hypothetical protein